MQGRSLWRAAPRWRRRSPPAPWGCGLRSWAGQFRPGEYLLAEVAAGGLARLRGPGGHVAVRLTQPAWIRIVHPPDAASRTARAGCARDVAVDLEQATGTLWVAQVDCSPAGPPTQRRAPADATAVLERVMPAAPSRRETGLAAWLAETLGDPRQPGAEQPGPTEAEAAALLLECFRPQLGPGVLDEAAVWLRHHVRAGVEAGDRRHWQWSLTALVWLFERAGITGQLRDHPEHAQELLAEGGFTATARRQTPFIQWRRGEAACAPGVRVPGTDVGSAEVAARVGRTCLSLQPVAEAALARLVAEETARLEGEAPAAPMSPEGEAPMEQDEEA